MCDSRIPTKLLCCSFIKPQRSLTSSIRHCVCIGSLQEFCLCSVVCGALSLTETTTTTTATTTAWYGRCNKIHCCDIKTKRYLLLCYAAFALIFCSFDVFENRISSHHRTHCKPVFMVFDSSADELANQSGLLVVLFSSTLYRA